MCGIAGIYSHPSIRETDRTDIRKMVSSMTHRGPDSDGFFSDSHMLLGMRRLSIIDIAGGAQPISSPDGRYHLICNGEIYNHHALRRTLRHLGYVFRTESDVEVILHLYHRFGLESLGMLEGMFAFALWDTDLRQLTVARDRIGIKPLFYYVSGGFLTFASELKSILKCSAIPSEIDLISLNQYLTFDYVPAPRTIVSNVRRLEPGQYFQLSDGVLTAGQYWSLSFAQSESRPPINASEYEKQFLEILTGAVSRELVADVPVGVFLSGGLDSSAVAAIAMKRSAERIKTFSIGFRNRSFDESGFARQVARHINSDHFEYILEESETVDLISRLGSLLDEPLADSSFIPTYVLSRFAKEKVTVALGGDGGDELFAGYPTLLAHKFVSLYERLIPFGMRAHLLPALVRKMPVSFNNISLDFKAKRFLRGRGVPFNVRHQLWLGSFDDHEKAELFHKDLCLDSLNSFEPVNRFISTCDAVNQFNQALYCDMKMYLEGDILTKVDRASMQHSLEVRVPLLNKSVVDFALGLPFEMKLKGFTSKYFLKQAARTLLPGNIINRKKKGFNIPLAEYLHGGLQDLTQNLLGAEMLEGQGLFNLSYVQRLLSDHMARKADNRKNIWNLLVFQLWYMENITSRR